MTTHWLPHDQTQPSSLRRVWLARLPQSVLKLECKSSKGLQWRLQGTTVRTNQKAEFRLAYKFVTLVTRCYKKAWNCNTCHTHAHTPQRSLAQELELGKKKKKKKKIALDVVAAEAASLAASGGGGENSAPQPPPSAPQTGGESQTAGATPLGVTEPGMEEDGGCVCVRESV